MEEAKFNYFKNAGRLVLYLGLAAGIFFASAVLILSLRGHRADVYPMPDVMHRYYVDVHNELTRIGLRVILEKKTYPDITPGVVLYQSIPAGKKVGRLEKVTIIINHAEPLLKMPDLSGNTLAIARATLGQITFQDVTYALDIAQVAEAFAEDQPEGAILSQYPLPGQSITTRQKVYLLVATRAKKKEKSWEKHSISILHELFSASGQKYAIKEIKPPPTLADNGIVFSSEEKKDHVLLGVYYKKPSIESDVGLNLLTIPGASGSCKIVQRQNGQEKIEYSIDLEQPQELRYIALRNGAVEYEAICNSKSLFKQRIEPEKFG